MAIKRMMVLVVSMTQHAAVAVDKADGSEILS
jgi:hypothetical protein